MFAQLNHNFPDAFYQVVKQSRAKYRDELGILPSNLRKVY
jgi:DNA-directed RNA polymerase specialized sigma54-like protein